MTEQTEPTYLPDDEFMENVRESRENGYDRLCAECGTGVYDGTEIHDRACSEYVASR